MGEVVGECAYGCVGAEGEGAVAVVVAFAAGDGVRGGTEDGEGGGPDAVADEQTVFERGQ